ncbi:MAG: hypothetical protein KF745_02530 [Phycisphaeraceae bacterium]|nr:hypothetical protein [Phycisphaeraceae bacterium]
MPPPAPSGRLEVIAGCMFSGKTTELIRRVASAVADGRRTVIIKPAADTRSGGHIRSHTGQSIPAVEVPDAIAVMAACEGADVVVIDEAHFFGPALTPVCCRLRSAGVRIIVAGVVRDHFGDPFEPIAGLAPLADEYTTLTAPCSSCGSPAIHSQRLINAAKRIAVGGAESYEARCDRCFVPTRR